MRLIKAALTMGLILGICWAKFDPCRFNFGYKSGTANINEADMIAQYTWAGASITSDVTGMLNTCKSSNKTPVIYMYIIAKSSGLGDCNTGGGLCSQGANYIRNNKDKIKGYYRDYAAAIKNTFGSTDPVICVMEPDYYQYTGTSQQGGGLSFADAGQLMGDLVDIVKGQLPNALISIDVSPWIEDQTATDGWLNAMPLSKVQYMSTSGGISQAASTLIKSDNKLTWKRVHDITHKCIIADCGYGTGGGGTGHDANWDNVSNLNARMSDGVIAIIQFSPKQDWGNTIKSISSQISKPICSCARSYGLTLNVGANGKVTKSPDAPTYDSGAIVTLTAVPNAGYKLRSWSGDVSGTNTTVTVTMTADKTIAATFVDVNAKPSYTLTITTTGSGIVEITPKQADYDSGTTVSLKAIGANGGTFNEWGGGALSGGNKLVTLLMDGNKTVTASFTGNNLVIPVNLIKNGDFADGTNNWNFATYNNAKATGTVVNGAYNLTIQTTGTEFWHIQLLQEGISLKQNENYVLTFTASSQSNTSIVANIGMSADPYTSYSHEDTITLTPTKKTYEVPFTMNAATTASARLEFNSGKASGAWYLDDISLAVALKLSHVVSPEPFFNFQDACVKTSRGKRVSVSWYDHAGRLLNSFSGDYSILTCVQVPQHSGSLIMVVRIGDRQFVKKILNIRK
jgi:hypothetical protein